MTSILELKVSHKNPKRPLRKLPSSIEVPSNATVDEVKKIVAKQASIKDHNRIGLFNPTTTKTLKDRMAKIETEEDVVKKKEVLVKDLGPQIAWRTVFLIEYLGPLLIHPLVLSIRPYFYPNIPIALLAGVPEPLNYTQKLVFGMIMLHFLKREVETLVVHKFSASTMPAFNIVRNSAFYWLLAGLLAALDIYHPNSMASRASFNPEYESMFNWLGIALYVFGEVSNALVHLNLASLRSTGGTERKIPRGYGFGLVTCPNYMFEVLAWVGMIVVSRSWAVTLFIAVGAAQMRVWAKGKEKSYRTEFGAEYKKKKYTMLPGFF